MQYSAPTRAAACAWLALSLCACSSAPAIVGYSQSSQTAGEPRFELYTTDPLLHAAAQRARQRIERSIGEPHIALAPAAAALDCQPLTPGCGVPLAFDELVYCHGSPEPALACTSQGLGGKALRIELQASLAGEELDNRLIHELFHVITYNRATHASDGLFMEYSVGHERISSGTLSAVCEHFACSRFVAEEFVAEEEAGKAPTSATSL